VCASKAPIKQLTCDLAAAHGPEHSDMATCELGWRCHPDPTCTSTHKHGVCGWRRVSICCNKWIFLYHTYLIRRLALLNYKGWSVHVFSLSNHSQP